MTNPLDNIDVPICYKCGVQYKLPLCCKEGRPLCVYCGLQASCATPASNVIGSLATKWRHEKPDHTQRFEDVVVEAAKKPDEELELLKARVATLELDLLKERVARLEASQVIDERKK